ncbi:MAG: hypothetical protein ACTHJ5_02665 [Ilyomonas sp.]
MDKQDKLHNQEAPSKNTDKAFVQVGKDGEPVIPKTEKKEKDKQNEKVIGRVDNTANSRFENEKQKPDISKIDQQEGDMKNGELGGNLNEDKE